MQKAMHGQGRGGQPMWDAWAALSGVADVGFAARPSADRAGARRSPLADWGKMKCGR
jgi:hypothetical protein